MGDSDLIITERLTDEELDAAEERAKKWLSNRSGSIVVTRDKAIGEKVMAYDVLDLIAELRERRAQDMNPTDIEHNAELQKATRLVMAHLLDTGHDKLSIAYHTLEHVLADLEHDRAALHQRGRRQ